MAAARSTSTLHGDQVIKDASSEPTLSENVLMNAVRVQPSFQWLTGPTVLGSGTYKSMLALVVEWTLVLTPLIFFCLVLHIFLTS
jgi:hypothetical protein